MHLYHSCIILWSVFSAFAKAQNLEDSTLLTSDTNFDTSNFDENNGDSSTFASSGNTPDISLIAQAPTTSTEDAQDFDAAKVTTGSDEGNPVQNSLRSQAKTYLIAEGGESFFDTTGWLAKGLEVI